MYRHNDRQGKTSVAMFACGLLLLGVECYGVRYNPFWFSSRVFYTAYFGGVFLELAAAGFGLAGRDSGKARIGLALSLLTLVLYVGFCCALFGLLGMGGSGVNG